MISGLTARSVRDPGPAALSLEVRKARVSDIPALLELINGYAARGIMLPRTEFEIAENIRDFSMALSGGRLAGCGALHFYSPAVGEIRSLAVDERAKAQGVGRQLVETLVKEAEDHSLDAVFAFTYVPDFFRKMAFEEVERGALPLKVWKDCLRCPKFECCDEIAVIRILRSEPRLATPGTWQGSAPPNEGMEAVLFPIVPET
jgi:amino-acid N-acetyltransferase